MTQGSLTATDLEQLAAAGISVEEAERQLAQLRSPPPPVRLLRPCLVGDGIRQFDAGQLQRLEEAGRIAARDGRVSKLVPASGAATRMFQAPLSLLDRPGLTAESLRRLAGDDRCAAEVVQLLDGAGSLPFFPDLARILRRRGLEPASSDLWADPQSVLRALLRPSGLGYADLPKGLIPFHRDHTDAALPGHRTAFEEHLVEATGYAKDRDGRCRLHFTVAAAHRAAVERHSTEAGSRFANRATFEVTFSTQSPATDTLALDGRGQPARREDGTLLLRPGGHGALLANLEAIGGDLVVIKNIDNVVPQRAQAQIARWKRVLIGLASELQQRSFELAAALDEGRAGAAREAAHFLSTEFGLPDLTTAGRSQLLARLERPLRVCGMVVNTGEPGGGPYWVRSAAFGDSPQIVERAQIDTADPAQAEALARATHFNPVDLVCAPRDRHGRPFDLACYVDPDTAFVADKRVGDRALRALERPGLWNGAMAGWNSLFVEVPLHTFAPVKTVLDLLRPEHQG